MPHSCPEGSTLPQVTFYSDCGLFRYSLLVHGNIEHIVSSQLLNLTEDLKCNVKLFADDTSLFTVVQDSDSAANDMTHDLELIRQFANDWRMSFNPDPQKQAVEQIFSIKKE